jgi:hypothetical protein
MWLLGIEFRTSLWHKDLFYYYMQVHCSCLQTDQKRASDLIAGGFEPPCGCWDLNWGPLEVLLTAEPSRQPPPPPFFFFVYECFVCMLEEGTKSPFFFFFFFF